MALANGELDRLAIATLQLLRRDLLPLTVLEPWVNRVASAATEAMAAPADRGMPMPMDPPVRASQVLGRAMSPEG